MPGGRQPNGYGSLYMNIALYPELGPFRRFGAYFAKKLHDDTSEVLACLEDVNRELQGLQEIGEKSILDCPLHLLKKKFPKENVRYEKLYAMWTEYEEGLVKYGQTLCMSQQIMNLPNQHPYYTGHLAEFCPPTFKAIFENGVFVPTGERAKTYQGLSERQDTCAWRDVPQNDFLTTRYVYFAKWIEGHVIRRLRRCFSTGKPSDPRIQTDVRHSRIVAVMDVLTCLVASATLTAAVLALAWVRPLKVRLAMVGALGTVFALLLKLMTGKITRGEVFAATAGFFAVAVVFVSSTTDDCVCR